jgi:anti-sigma B factor antagonist
VTAQTGDVVDDAAFDVRVVRHRGVATITLVGELDLDSTSAVESCIASLRSRRPLDVVVDASGLTFCDAAGLSALLTLRDVMRHSGHQVRLIETPHCLSRLLGLLGMEDCFI